MFVKFNMGEDDQFGASAVAVAEVSEMNDSQIVQVGSLVTLQFPDYDSGEKGEIATFRLVGTPVIHAGEEPELYIDSIVGQAIRDKLAGETAEVVSPDRSLKYLIKILSVEN